MIQSSRLGYPSIQSAHHLPSLPIPNPIPNPIQSVQYSWGAFAAAGLGGAWMGYLRCVWTPSVMGLRSVEEWMDS